MMAAMNTPAGEEILEDINNIVFSALEKPYSRTIWAELEEAYYNGASEEYLYNELERIIKEENEGLD